ncbi:hypothetical protein [Paraburkholderia kururiensis]|uniref:hypothetical protein n=1 Tax=Paraburkholderia kururiensis TaxID=984307 RepID=UPI000F867816|nr:hypothetical protein [Paraburkholderia kururiensis]
MAGDGLGEVLRLLSSCAGHIGTAGSWPDAVDAECCMEQFRASVHLLLARHPGADVGLAAGAYDLGLATGFYGRDAAVTAGLAGRYGARLEQARGQDPQALRWLGGLLRSGYLHGRDIREWARLGEGRSD